MKKIYLLCSFLMSFLFVNAQKDTLLFEGFEKDLFTGILTEPTGKDTKWIAWDQDGKAAGDATIGSKWYTAPEYYQKTVSKPAVLNQTAHSLSWLAGDIPGSKNVLISPPITISDDKATLSWKSCPTQGPSFMDGYKVLITTTSNDVTKAKPDTVFVASEVTSYLDPSTTALKDWKFSKGRIHANGYTIKQFFDTTYTAAWNLGRLEPHTVSLAKYKGKKIYVHLLHDSNDDFILEIDDILVRGNKSTSANDAFANNIRLVTYPNPVVNKMNVLYRVDTPSDVHIEVVDIQGKVVESLFCGKKVSGEMNHDFDVSTLPNGAYLLNVRIGEKVASEKFVK